MSLTVPVPARLNSASSILAVRDLAAALDHYERLGFEVRAYEGGDEYGYAHRDGVDLHLTGWDEHDPLRTGAGVYLYVDDADALYAEWQAADVGGRLHAPQDTDYGLREGAHVDPEGNLLRFGSRISA